MAKQPKPQQPKPLREGFSKGNTKPSTGGGRQAPPPPPPPKKK